jgi:hypothetical protein
VVGDYLIAYRIHGDEERAHAGDHAISKAEVWGTSPGAIENQQLLLDE